MRWLTLPAFVLLPTGCSACGMPQNAAHLSASLCPDLTALRNNAPPTSKRNLSELAALRRAG